MMNRHTTLSTLSLSILLLWLCYTMCYAQQIEADKGVSPNMYKWSEFTDIWHFGRKNEEDEGAPEAGGVNITERLHTRARQKGKILASQELGKPVYMSLTTISSRVYGIGKTIEVRARFLSLSLCVCVFVVSRGCLWSAIMKAQPEAISASGCVMLLC